MKKLLLTGWFITIAALGILSYTQVDLNLTLLNWQPYLTLQQQFTWLGYFNRPLNGTLFAILFVALLTGYFAMIKAALAGWLSVADIKKIALVTSVLLLFSYSVFSHDIFNYIFDARIITKYHQNPYAQKALDYPADDWIRFMQWTHRTYPYGPTWLIITVVPSVLGLGKLLPTFLLFKLIFVLAYNALVYYTIKIHEVKKSLSNAIPPSVALVAFNPLIIVDGLVSSRIDLVMAALALIATYYHIKASLETYARKKNDRISYFWLLFSGGTKFATLGFFPVFFAGYKQLKEQKFFLALFVFAMITVPMQIYLRGLQPWYFILPFTLLPFLYPHFRLKKLIIFAVIMLLPMSAYLHFMYTGISKDALWFLSV